MLGYVMMYLGLGALILGVFSLSPWGGLLLFLGYSMWHFGEADFAHWRFGRSGMALLWGGYILGGILGSHVHETVTILREMRVNVPFDLLANHTFGTWWILSGGAFFIGWKRNRFITTSVLSLLILSALPLIPAFAVFFIFQHSFHGWKKLKELNSESDVQQWIKALPFTLGACLLFGLNAYFESFTWGQVFIFLAALSFPHVVLMATLYRKSSVGAWSALFFRTAFFRFSVQIGLINEAFSKTNLLVWIQELFKDIGIHAKVLIRWAVTEGNFQ